MGVIYVAYGRKARDEATASIATLRQFHSWPVTVIGDEPLKNADINKHHADTGTPGRSAKTSLDLLTAFDRTLFLDADTRVHGRLDAGFRLLEYGWPLVMIPSEPQHNEALRHLDKRERAATIRELPLDPLQLNTGVIWFDRVKAAPFFAVWRSEWQRWHDKDQGAFLRALYKHPVPIALLGPQYNSRNGTIVEHRFGACT